MVLGGIPGKQGVRYGIMHKGCVLPLNYLGWALERVTTCTVEYMTCGWTIEVVTCIDSIIIGILLENTSQ